MYVYIIYYLLVTHRGIRYGVTLLNEKLIKKYGSGLEGVRISQQVVSKRDWRKSGLPRPSLATFAEGSLPMDEYSDGSTSDEDDGSYFDTESPSDVDDETASYNSNEANTDDWSSEYSGEHDDVVGVPPHGSTDQVKFGTKLLPGSVMAELKSHDEVHEHEARLPQKLAKACTFFELDVDAKEFKTCLCGHLKKDHSVAAGGDAGAITGLAPAGGSFMNKWTKVQGNDSFQDPLEKRKEAEQKIKKQQGGSPQYLKPSGATSAAAVRKPGSSHATRGQGRVSERRRPSANTSANIPSNNRGSKKRVDTRRPAPQASRGGGSRQSAKPQSAKPQSAKPKGRGYYAPKMPAPKKLSPTTGNESPTSGDGPCGKFEFDIRTGDAYGNCHCGYSRADHDKVKYRTKVAQSLRVKWNQSPYR
jgi:hypothetical protein